MQRSALCRSRRELSNAYLLAKFGFDTAENEPSKVCRIRRPTNGSARRPWPGKRGGSSDVNAGLQEKRILSEYRWMFEMYQCKEVDANLIYKCITKY